MPASALDLARKLIRCPSVTPRDEGALEVLASFLRPLGFTCEILTFGEVSNLFARLGEGSPHFCFAGHTDVVPAGDEAAWTHPPFGAEVESGVLYGRGAVDMKGGVAASAAAAALYLERHGPPKGSISFLITGDEEGPAINGTAKVLEWMQKNGHVPDACLVGEPTNPEALGDELKIGRRGSLTGYLTVAGKQGHVAYPQLADNPLPRLCRMLDVLSGTVFDQGSAHFPPSNLEITTIDTGNTADNVIPAKARASFNIRFSDRWTGPELEAKIRSILDGVDPRYALEMRCGAESFITRPGELSNLVSSAVEEVTGRKPELSTKGGTSDARFIHHYCPVVEFGLINKTAHHIDERAAVADLETLSEIYVRVLELYLS